ncbi:MAG: DUF979 domain-containing protein [Rhizomicrobium sp.]|jgi:uncharacterized membrane protein
MITLEQVYIFAGLVFASVAVLSGMDKTNPKRIGNALFWGLFAASFLLGSHIGDFANGVLVLGLMVVGGFGFLARGHNTDEPAERGRRAAQYGNGLFVPALVIPAMTLLGTLLLPHIQLEGRPLADPKQLTVISLAAGIIVALGAAMLWLRPKWDVPLQEGRRLADMIGWAAVLPQMLASLGAVFKIAGVGVAVGMLATGSIPLHQPLVVVAVYCVGMAVFTIVMGNAFAAFPVMTTAIGLPLIVQKFGGDPAIMASIGMLSGFCGTLVTPMAANFNIVPARLLELPDRYGVIKAQIPTALLLLLVNMTLMYELVFRFGAHH